MGDNNNTQHVTVEKTKKSLKGELAFCWLLFFVGVYNLQPTIIGLTMVWYVFLKIRIWWNHG